MNDQPEGPFRSDERRTFEEKVGEALDVLFDGALLLTGEPERAERLVLSAVAATARRPDVPEDDEEFRRWLCGRMVRQYLRYAAEADEEQAEEKVRGGPSVIPHPVLVSSEDAAIEELLGRLEVLDRHAPDRLGALIRRELGRLPLRARAALWLVDVLGASYAEASRDLDVPRSGLRSRLFAGRRELQARLAAALQDDVRLRRTRSESHGEGGS